MKFLGFGSADVRCSVFFVMPPAGHGCAMQDVGAVKRLRPGRRPDPNPVVKGSRQERCVE